MTDERGLTLVEILAAAAILGIAIAGLFAIVPAAGTAIEEGGRVSTATFLAQQRLEEIGSGLWTDRGDCLGVSRGSNAPASTSCNSRPSCTTGLPCVTFPDESSIGPDGGYTRTVRVTDCGMPGCSPGPAREGLRLATVTVAYHPRIGTGALAEAKQVRLDLLVTRR